VLEAVEGPMVLAPCIAEDCGRSSVCATRAVWEEANDALKKLFSSVTVAELAEQGRKMESMKTISFEI
jgi:DNA-binding IscR family transcriptional regulator